MAGGELEALIGTAQAARALELSEEELARRAGEHGVVIYRRPRGERWEDAIQLDDLKRLREGRPSEAVQVVQRDLERVRRELYDALGLYDQAEERREDDQRRLRALRRELREHRRENSADRDELEGRQRALVEKLEAQRREFAASKRELAEIEEREVALRRQWTDEVEGLRTELDRTSEGAAETVAELRAELAAEVAARATLEGEIDELKAVIESSSREYEVAREEHGRALAAQQEAIEEEMTRLRLDREAAIEDRDRIEGVAARAKREALEAEAKLARHVEAKDREISSMEESAARWRGQCLEAERRIELLETELAEAREVSSKVAQTAAEGRDDAAERLHRLRDDLREAEAQARRAESEANGLRPKVAALGEELERARQRTAELERERLETAEQHIADERLRQRAGELEAQLEETRRELSGLETQLERSTQVERATQRYADRTEAKLRRLQEQVAGTANGRVGGEAAEEV